jgi:hypothetical protein
MDASQMVHLAKQLLPFADGRRMLPRGLAEFLMGCVGERLKKMRIPIERIGLSEARSRSFTSGSLMTRAVPSKRGT